jgi:PKHD-type hydroxylase
MKKQESTVWPLHLDKVNSFAWCNLFTKDECEQIKDIGSKHVRKKAEVQLSNTNNSGYNKKFRESDISWIYPHEEVFWIFKRITDFIINYNDKYFGFDIYAMNEGFQYTVYNKDNFFVKHIDRAYDTPIRKLSLSIQLSDPKTYSGGDLILIEGQKKMKMEKNQGHAVIFPSWVEHKITKIKKGKREALVAWVTGPSFK